MFSLEESMVLFLSLFIFPLWIVPAILAYFALDPRLQAHGQ